MSMFIDIKYDKEGYKISDEFAEIPFKKVMDKYGERGLLFVALMTDYWSPYRHLQGERKRKEIQKALKISNDLAKVEIIQQAMQYYKELQYDPLLEQYQVYKQKVKDITEIIKKKTTTDKNVKEIQDMIRNMDKVNDIIISLSKYIEERGRKTGANAFFSIQDYHMSKNN